MQKLFTVVSLIALTGSVSAQVGRDVAALKNWPAPLYWQPTAEEHRAATGQSADYRVREAAAGTASDATPPAATPLGALVFVAMSPCRVADTRNPNGALGFLTAGPTPITTTPNFSTLNSYLGTVVANAAIVPAGTSGSIDLYVSQNTDAIIDSRVYGDEALLQGRRGKH